MLKRLLIALLILIVQSACSVAQSQLTPTTTLAPISLSITTTPTAAPTLDLTTPVAAITAAAPTPFVVYGFRVNGTIAFDGFTAVELPSGREISRLALGSATQGTSFALSAQQNHAYVLDRDASDWRLNDVSLPTMQVVKRTTLSDVINLLGTVNVLAVSADGQEVYVETARIVGPARWDKQLGTGQPDTDYSIAVYDVAQGTFVRSIPLERPWCGVASLFALPDGQLLVRCPTARDVRWIDTRLGKQVASTSVGGVGGVLSRDGHSFWIVAENAHLFEIDIAKRAVTRSSELSDGLSPTLPFQQPHLSADGRRLFVRAAPHDDELWYHGLGTVVWIVDTNTLQRVAAVRLPAPAYDMAPSPDGRTLIISTLNTDKRDEWGSRLIDIATGQELGRWPWMQIGMQTKGSN